MKKFKFLKPLRSKLLIIINSSIAVAIFSVLFAWYLTWPAIFVIKNQSIKYTEPIVIEAANSTADHPLSLNVMFDGSLFEKQGIPKEKKEFQTWHFMIKNQSFLPDMIKAGKHKIKVGFPGDKLSEEFIIVFKEHDPLFIILNPHLRSDATMKIKADNDDANIKQILHVEFDGVLFPETGLPVDSNQKQLWHCNLQKLKLTQEMKKNGNHEIRFRFPGGKFSKKHKIILLTQRLVVNTQLQRKGNVNFFRGKTAGKSQIKDNEFKVEVIFYHEGPDNKISVPIHKKTDQATGIVYYEFETKFSGFPEISPDDEKYSKPFFEFKITDKAGNQFRQQQSYAQFIAPGNSLSANADWKDINIKKQLPDDRANNLLTNIFSLVPVNQNLDDKLTINLTVNCITKNIRHLKWNDNKTMTLVFRDGEKIATTDSNEYLDKDAMSKESVSYSVVQKNKDGEVFTSKTVVSDIPPENFALLTVRSNVKNDLVFIDGKKCGSTRLDKKLRIGNHKIRVEKKGYKPFELSINLKKDKVIWANLKPLPGTLHVTTKPEGALIYVNGRKKGISPAKFKNIAPGDAEVKVELLEYEIQKKTIKIQSEKVEYVNFNLNKIVNFYNINITTQPSGAKIFVNGKQKGLSPITLKKTLPGSYEIKATLKGYKEKLKQVLVADKNKNITLNLLKKPLSTQKYHLRSKPVTLTDEQLSKLRDQNLYPRRYIDNDFVDNSDETITDRATGLMWQKGGSDSYMKFDDAKTYINKLNKSNFGGYNDWRLPTLEELISLLESKKMGNELYINPMFDSRQGWCWSSDTRASSGAFVVGFDDGEVNWTTLFYSDYVRAVRSFPDNDG